MKNIIESKIYDFFIKSNDFNGIPLRQISKELDIDYRESIDIIKELVRENKVSIQSSTNPHIIGKSHFPIDNQIFVLESAKDIVVEYQQFGELKFSLEKTDFPICLYPTTDYLKSHRNLDDFGYSYYSKQLAQGEPQLKPIFFDIEVLERYYNDPRFEFKFEDYSGRITCKCDESYQPIVRNEDDVFIKTFGIGFDENGNRLAVVFLRYLHNLTGEHQIFWKNKERKGNCKILEEYYINTIEGNWTTSYSIYSALLEEQKCVNELALIIFNSKLFNETFEQEKRPREFTFFLSPTLKNYNDFILLLDKMISDNINKSFFKGKCELYELKEENGIFLKQNKGTLRLLEDWLSSVISIEDENDSIAKLLLPFRKIRQERQTPAHKINENTYDINLVQKQKKTISEVYNAMRQLRHLFSLHPKAKDYKTTDWLINGKILNL